MAIKKDITVKGVSIKDAYIRVRGFSGNKSGVTAFIDYKASADQEFSFHESHVNFELDLSGGNPVEQAYKFIKTLPEFSGAEDC